VGDKDRRGELVRCRLTQLDLDRVSAIQDYYEGVGLPTNLQQVFSDAIAAYYHELVAKGVDIEHL
jgi:hypothetical protein